MALPNGYTQLEYIESTGKQYINTGINSANTVRVELDFQFLTLGGWIFGARVSANNSSIEIFPETKQDYWRSIFGNKSHTIAGLHTNRTTGVVSEDVISIGDQSVTTTKNTFSSTVPIFLFALSANGTPGNYSTARMWSCRMYESGTLVRNFVPAKNAQGVAGMYDTVGGAFYPSNSATAFVAGTPSPSVGHGTKLGDLAVGTNVYTNVNGVRTDFIVIHKGLPSSDYDNSCDGVWLLMKDAYVLKTYGGTNSYKSSALHQYLNNTFVNLLDSAVQSLVKTVKIPYTDGTGKDGSLVTGASGLSVKCFALSCAELDDVYDDVHVNREGAPLQYFADCDISTRVAYRNGASVEWWTRSPVKRVLYNDGTVGNDGISGAHYVTTNGLSANIGSAITREYGVRPAFILPYDVLVDGYRNIILAPAAVHNTLIDGTSRSAVGGNALVGGTSYKIKKGRTLVGGTGFDINFKREVGFAYTGTYNMYGDYEKGWVELLTSGTLTIGGGDGFDVYLLGQGSKGDKGTTVNWDGPATGGKGGSGGIYKELFAQDLEGDYAVFIPTGSSTQSWATVGSLSSSGGKSVASGGAGANNKVASNGGDGRQPFADNSPMSQGFAQYKLGAGGGGGGAFSYGSYYKNGKGGTYGGGDGEYTTKAGSGKANTGSGGGGGFAFSSSNAESAGTPGAGGSGIVIIRWGY